VGEPSPLARASPQKEAIGKTVSAVLDGDGERLIGKMKSVQVPAMKKGKNNCGRDHYMHDGIIWPENAAGTCAIAVSGSFWKEIEVADPHSGHFVAILRLRRRMLLIQKMLHVSDQLIAIATSRA
jgi:hypothetical protein